MLKRMIRLDMFGWLLAVLFVIGICSCSYKPKSLKVLSSRPVRGTSSSTYPTIEKIYESDNEVTFVCTWGRSVKTGSCELRWDIYNQSNERIYTKTYSDARLKPSMYYYHTLSVDRIGLKPGRYTISVSVDDDLAISQNFEFIPMRITNRNITGAVILPFSDISTETYCTAPWITDSIASAVYLEVKRIIPGTVPHYVSEQNLGKNFEIKLDNTECVAKLKDTFKEDLFITGSVELPKFVGAYSDLTIFVYDKRKGDTQTYQHSLAEHQQTSYANIIHNLIKGVLYEEGFLEDLKSF